MDIDLVGFESAMYMTSYSANTVRIYVKRVEAFANSGETSFLAWISGAHRAGAKAQVVMSMLCAAKAYCKWAELDHQTSLLRAYRPPNPGKPNPHPLPGRLDDVRKLLDHSTGRMKLGIALGALAGTRASETRSLTTDSIVNNRLVIRGKGDKVRRVPISQTLHNVIEETVDSPGKLVPYSDSWFREKIRKVAVDAGVRHEHGAAPSSHDLRATFATCVYENTKDVYLVSELLGHADVKQTQVYLGINEEYKERSVELL